MRKINDKMGRKFGALLVVGLAIERQRRAAVWLCLCDCGVHILVHSSNLGDGTVSCGRCNNSPRFKHGAAKHETPEYRTWKAMRKRCHDPKSSSFKRYGGRGITVCNRWDLFSNFLADMGKKPTSVHTIERINNDLGYTPENCRWATMREQRQNKSTGCSLSAVELEQIKNLLSFGFTQRKIAQLVGRSPTTVWSVKHGAYNYAG